jgi:hypothetical protein
LRRDSPHVYAHVSDESATSDVVVIPIIFNVIRNSSGTLGNIPYSAIQNQINHANDAFAGKQNVNGSENVKINLVLQGIHLWDDSDMHWNCETLDFESDSIRNLQTDPLHTINVFTCKMEKYSGWAWACFCEERFLPFLGESGFFVDYRYITPSKEWDPITQHQGDKHRVGDTFVHELGREFP